MTEPEPTYTRAQWEQMQRDERCASRMHQLQPVGQDACRLHCPECSRTFQLVPE